MAKFKIPSSPKSIAILKKTNMLRVVCIGMALLLPVAAMASEALIKVRISSAVLSQNQRDQVVLGELSGSTYSLVSSSADSLEILTDTNGVERLSAIPELSSIKEQPQVSTPRNRKPSDALNFRVSLKRKQDESARNSQKAIPSDAYTVELKKLWPSQKFERSGFGGHRNFQIEGLDSKGNVVAIERIEDPRILRFEATDRNGAFIGRQDFIRDFAEFDFSFEADDRIVKVRFSSTNRLGSKTIIGEIVP